jgi:uncharacterized OB-fold protein
MSLAPVIHSETARVFWDECREQRLVLPKCDGCGRLRWYLQPLCPRCRHDSFTLSQLSGRASLFTFTVVHRAFHETLVEDVPYVTAFVNPAEDPDVRLVTQLTDVRPQDVVVGMALEVRFVNREGVVYPLFAPATEQDRSVGAS